ncbi:OmpH family outer membrane protein, partial [Candidatus Saganbacteria bacterium]|nr:OmpH family outer membrane protein [Candidatus Saganbacteria bacterium]
MKKLLMAVIALFFAAGISHAANFSGIGFIDVQKVFREYKETTKAQGELAKQEESFKKEFEESQKKLEAAEKSGKKKDELDKMKKELEETLAPKRDVLLRSNQQLTGRLQAAIVDAVKKAAKKVGIDIVLDKQV